MVIEMSFSRLRSNTKIFLRRPRLRGSTKTDRPFRPIRSDQPMQRRPTDPQFPRHLIDVRHRQTFVAVPLQKTADRLLAPAALKPGALLFIIVRDAFFDIRFDRQLCPQRSASKFSQLMAKSMQTSRDAALAEWRALAA